MRRHNSQMIPAWTWEKALPKSVAWSCCLGVLLCTQWHSTPANAQVGDVSQTLVTKVYNIADLIETPLMLGDADSGSQAQHARRGPGAGGMMGGGGGGGGFFRVSDNVLPQFGGGGMGGGGIQSLPLPDRMTREALEDIVLLHLNRDGIEWVETAGQGGELSIVGSIMVVTQTKDVHVLIEGLLDSLRAGNSTSPTVQVDVRLVDIPSGEVLPEAGDYGTIAEDRTAARITLRCDNHRVARISAGLRRSYVVSLTPVVGDNVGVGNAASAGVKMGYQPVTASPLLGLFGQIKPEIDSDVESGRIHLGIELASGPEEVLAATFGNGTTMDRMEIESARVETSVRAAAKTWTLAGVVAVCDPSSSLTSGEALPHVAVLVRWQPAP